MRQPFATVSTNSNWQKHYWGIRIV